MKELSYIWFLSNQKDKLICLDEIQRVPDLFPLIRSIVDEWGDNAHFLMLGSATRDLIKQNSEISNWGTLSSITGILAGFLTLTGLIFYGFGMLKIINLIF